MLFKTEFDAGHQSVETGHKPDFKIAMTPPFNADGLQSRIEGHQMRVGGQPFAPEQGCRQQTTQPRRPLQDRQFIPGIKRQDGLQHRRLITGG